MPRSADRNFKRIFSPRPLGPSPRTSAVRDLSWNQKPPRWFTEGFDTMDLQEAKALLAELGEERGRRPRTSADAPVPPGNLWTAPAIGSTVVLQNDPPCTRVAPEYDSHHNPTTAQQGQKGWTRWSGQPMWSLSEQA